jgi:hypothetical protein
MSDSGWVVRPRDVTQQLLPNLLKLKRPRNLPSIPRRINEPKKMRRMLRFPLEAEVKSNLETPAKGVIEDPNRRGTP